MALEPRLVDICSQAITKMTLKVPDPEESQGTLQRGKKLPQYIAALSVCLGSVAAGGMMGWTSNIEQELTSGELNGVQLTDLGWVGSLATLGALFSCFFIGKMCDFLGRKVAMLSLVIPFTLGWLLIIFAQNVAMLLVGRFVTGFAGGAFCVSAPLYTSEIAEVEIRGTLGSYFQLLLTVGILLAYILGSFLHPIPYSIVLAIIPLVFGIVFFTQPETPVYRMKQGKEEEARQSLLRLRGPQYDVDAEIKEIKRMLEEDEKRKVPFFQSFRKRETVVATVISFGLMFFQQASGVNAVIFYTSNIFNAANVQLDSKIATIIVGVMQVVATFISSLVVDKLGRRLLLIGSIGLMSISILLLAVYYSLNDRLEDNSIARSINFIPVICLCVFIVAFSFGFGPIPWMISAEVYPEEVKSTLSSAAGVFNWFIAFLITRFYPDMQASVLGGDGTFYVFGGVCVAGAIFCLTYVPETKGKSLEQIQAELRGEKFSANTDKSGIDNPSFS
ncbi:facilitated trehalose transporter Tret1 isoform X2 [Agrilus planipennis]|uniref:Facilitated trehalose transporter Tret1 isoform X2 n=1 Tax=Agrilus planipennis TaxID=224129 RepID=A0A1W4WPW7_AGRPL|nr:facilitated trehalose transporter Tret1 isoform X2 [Agrilus planipennis]